MQNYFHEILKGRCIIQIDVPTDIKSFAPEWVSPRGLLSYRKMRRWKTIRGVHLPDKPQSDNTRQECLCSDHLLRDSITLARGMLLQSQEFQVSIFNPQMIFYLKDGSLTFDLLISFPAIDSKEILSNVL